MYDSGRFSLA